MPPLRLRNKLRKEIQNLLQHVKRHVRHGEKLRCIGGREADVGDGIAGEVRRAEGEELRSPDAEDEALGPGFSVRGGGNGVEGRGDEAHYHFGVIIELDVEEEPDVFFSGGGEVF